MGDRFVVAVLITIAGWTLTYLLIRNHKERP